MDSKEKSQNLSEIEKLLKNNVEKEVLIRLKNNISVKGKLRVFDQHLNLTLKKGEVISGEKKEGFENLLVRGSDILVVSLLDHQHSKEK